MAEPRSGESGRDPSEPATDHDEIGRRLSLRG